MVALILAVVGCLCMFIHNPLQTQGVTGGELALLFWIFAVIAAGLGF